MNSASLLQQCSRALVNASVLGYRQTDGRTDGRSDIQIQGETDIQRHTFVLKPAHVPGPLQSFQICKICIYITNFNIDNMFSRFLLGREEDNLSYLGPTASM